MPIQRFKNVLRDRFARAAEFKGGPFEPTGFGVVRHSGDQWRATGGDPQFLFPAPKQVSSLVLYVAAERDGALTPRIYFNWGGGFSQDDSVGFEPARAALIRLSFEGCPDLRRLRFDPHGGHGGVFVPLGGRRRRRGARARRRARACGLRGGACADPARKRRALPISRRRCASDLSGSRASPEPFTSISCTPALLAARELKPEAAPPKPLISFVSPRLQHACGLSRRPLRLLLEATPRLGRTGAERRRLDLGGDGEMARRA